MYFQKQCPGYAIHTHLGGIISVVTNSFSEKCEWIILSNWGDSFWKDILLLRFSMPSLKHLSDTNKITSICILFG